MDKPVEWCGESDELAIVQWAVEQSMDVVVETIGRIATAYRERRIPDDTAADALEKICGMIQEMKCQQFFVSLPDALSKPNHQS